MTDRIPATEARATLPDLLDRVDRGEEIEISRHGKVVAVMVRPDALRARRADRAFAAAAAVREAVARGRSAPIARRGLSADRAEELVSQLRVARESR